MYLCRSLGKVALRGCGWWCFFRVFRFGLRWRRGIGCRHPTCAQNKNTRRARQDRVARGKRKSQDYVRLLLSLRRISM